MLVIQERELILLNQYSATGDDVFCMKYKTEVLAIFICFREFPWYFCKIKNFNPDALPRFGMG